VAGFTTLPTPSGRSAVRRGSSLASSSCWVLGPAPIPAIFNLVHAVRLRPLPYERPEDVVMVWNARKTAGNWRAHATKETVLAWRDSPAGVLSDLAVIKLWDGSREAWIDLVLADRAERLRAGLVTSNFFRTLGVSAAIGRVFSPDDEAKGDTAIVVLSDALWRRAFGADSSVVGRQITLTRGDSRNRRPRSYLVLGCHVVAGRLGSPLTELLAFRARRSRFRRVEGVDRRDAAARAEIFQSRRTAGASGQLDRAHSCDTGRDGSRIYERRAVPRDRLDIGAYAKGYWTARRRQWTVCR
jgi:MacB-like protein